MILLTVGIWSTTYQRERQSKSKPPVEAFIGSIHPWARLFKTYLVTVTLIVLLNLGPYER